MEPQLVTFDTAGDFTIANGNAFKVPPDAYAIDIYVIGGGGSSDTWHDSPSPFDNCGVIPATSGATVKHTVVRSAVTLVPGEAFEFTIGAGGADPINTGMCTVDPANLGRRGAPSVLYDPAFPGNPSHIKLKAAGGGRGSYCAFGAKDIPGPGSCLTGALNECFNDAVPSSESLFDAAAGDKHWAVPTGGGGNATAQPSTCAGKEVSAAVQPTGDAPGCGPGAAMERGVNYTQMTPARAGGVIFRITPCGGRRGPS